MPKELSNKELDIVAAFLEGALGKGIGFALLVLPYSGEAGGIGSFISNVDREDAINALEDFGRALATGENMISGEGAKAN